MYVRTQFGRKCGDTRLPTYARESQLCIYWMMSLSLAHCGDYRHHYALLYSHLRPGIINWPLFPTASQKLAAAAAATAPNRVSQDKTLSLSLPRAWKSGHIICLRVSQVTQFLKLFKWYPQTLTVSYCAKITSNFGLLLLYLALFKL